MSFLPAESPEAKLRVRNGSSSPSADDLGVRFHPNMRVPESSIVTLGFNDAWGEPKVGTEALKPGRLAQEDPSAMGKFIWRQ